MEFDKQTDFQNKNQVTTVMLKFVRAPGDNYQSDICLRNISPGDKYHHFIIIIAVLEQLPKWLVF